MSVHHSKSLFVSLLIALGAVCGIACQRSSEETPAQAESPRIVALSPAIGIILRDMGLGDRVVGRHAYDQFLPKNIPACGDQSGIDMERLISRHPTHVLTQWGTRDLPENLLTQARERGWVVANIEILTLADISRAVVTIDQVVSPAGSAAPSEGALSLVKKLEAALTPDPTPPTAAGRVLLLASTSPLAALGPGSCHHEILLALGGTPAIAEGAPYVYLDAEDLMRLDPDSIVLVLPRSPGAVRFRMDPAMMLTTVADHGLRAIDEQRVELIDHPEALIPSTSMIHFAAQLRTSLARLARDQGTQPAPGPQ
jgi:ABC-type hemin transport system substrate-binding protein